MIHTTVEIAKVEHGVKSLYSPRLQMTDVEFVENHCVAWKV